MDSTWTLRTKKPIRILEALQWPKNIDKAHKRNEISVNEWINPFSSLLNNSASTNTTRDQSMTEYIRNAGSQIFNELNHRLSEPEIMSSAMSLKRNKAPGTDSIINGMIKSGITNLKSVFTHLFNSIFSLGHYPNIWRTNSLSLLHKKGDRKSCDNYRSITVGCCLSKLFLTVLNKRLVNFVNTHSIIPKKQTNWLSRKMSTTWPHSDSKKHDW